MMKRILSFVAAISVALACMVPCVYAEDAVNFFGDGCNVLDYATANDSGSNVFDFYGSTKIRYTLPGKQFIQYVDMVFMATGSAPESVQLYQAIGDGVAMPLKLEHIGDFYYRAYGVVDCHFVDSVTIQFTAESTTWTKYEIISLYTHGSISDSFEEIGRMKVTATSETSVLTQDYAGDPLIYVFPVNDLDDPFLMNYHVKFMMDNWSKYDYVEFIISVRTESITSISAQFNNISLPIEVSYLNTSDSTNDDTFTGSAPSEANIMIRVDLTGVDRTEISNPYVVLEGMWDDTTSLNDIILYWYTGYIVSDSESGAAQWWHVVRTWFADQYNTLTSTLSSAIVDVGSRVTSGFSSLVNRINEEFTSLRTLLVTNANNIISSIQTGITNVTDKLEELLGQDSQDADDFADDMEDQSTQAGDMMDQIDTVTKPAAGDIDVDLSDIVSDSQVVLATAPLTAILGNELFLQMGIITLTLSLVAYVIYGKR